MASTSSVSGELKTTGILITAEGKEINLGVLDNRTGIKIDLFGKHIDLTFPWTPRLWFYKHITYRQRLKKQAKELK